MSVKGLQIQVLGELVVLVDGRPVEVPGSRKTRALLAYLLLQDRPVTREHLCELLWPHPDHQHLLNDADAHMLPDHECNSPEHFLLFNIGDIIQNLFNSVCQAFIICHSVSSFIK